MKIVVPVKRVADPNVSVRVRGDGLGVDLGHVKMAMNPFDEIALEAALRLREAGHAAEVIAVSVGPKAAEETLRTALAMGADRAVLVEADGPVEPLAVARLLKGIIDAEGAALALLGKQATDDDCNQTGQMLAALLDWPQATFASEIAVLSDGGLEVTGEIDGGLEVVRLTLPAVVTADLRLATPRYASLPAIMKARRKPLQTIVAGALGVDIARQLVTVSVRAPEPRKAGVKVASAAELVGRLKDAGLVA